MADADLWSLALLNGFPALPWPRSFPPMTPEDLARLTARQAELDAQAAELAAQTTPPGAPAPPSPPMLPRLAAYFEALEAAGGNATLANATLAGNYSEAAPPPQPAEEPLEPLP